MPRPRKRFGQHFLIDQTVIDNIIDELMPSTQDHIVEIGPGTGALTLPLLPLAGKYTAIEIDFDLAPKLLRLGSEYENFELIRDDALKVDYSALSEKKIRLVGNLPYNISSQIIVTQLRYASNIQDMHFMLQKEMADRLCATPHSKTYGRITVLAQYYCQIEHLFDVEPEAFNPPPAVRSSVIRLIPYDTLPVIAQDEKILREVIAASFISRRKHIANCLKKIIEKESLVDLGIDPSARAENLSVADFVTISNYLVKS